MDLNEKMIIEKQNLILRDMIESDIEDYVLWFTKDIEWQDYDAPWEKEESNISTELKKWTNYYIYKKNSANKLRNRFEIEYNGVHIGWVISYYINDKYEYVSSFTSEKTFLAIGIDICNLNYQGNGIGTKALSALIDYYNSIGIKELYTQTWSGNIRMIKLAHKLGFVECDKKIGIREVNNNKYDALTFVLYK